MAVIAVIRAELWFSTGYWYYGWWTVTTGTVCYQSTGSANMCSYGYVVGAVSIFLSFFIFFTSVRGAPACLCAPLPPPAPCWLVACCGAAGATAGAPPPAPDRAAPDRAAPAGLPGVSAVHGPLRAGVDHRPQVSKLRPLANSQSKFEVVLTLFGWIWWLPYAISITGRWRRGSGDVQQDAIWGAWALPCMQLQGPACLAHGPAPEPSPPPQKISRKPVLGKEADDANWPAGHWRMVVWSLSWTCFALYIAKFVVAVVDMRSAPKGEHPTGAWVGLLEAGPGGMGSRARPEGVLHGGNERAGPLRSCQWVQGLQGVQGLVHGV